MSGFPDNERQLSDYGRDQVAGMAATHSSIVEGLDAVVSSPYTRAQQTADIFAREIGFSKAITTLDALVPEGRPVEVESYLFNMNVSQLILISHMPLVANLIEFFCGETGRMKTASLALITMQYPGCGQGDLSWIHHAP